MRPDTFRDLALELPDVELGRDHDHPAFRLDGRIIATVGYPDAGWGTLMLQPPQQRELVEAAPEAFRPAAGAWGRKGCTSVRLAKVTAALLRRGLRMAYENRVAVRRVAKAR